MGSGTSKCAWSYTVTPINPTFGQGFVFFFENGEKADLLFQTKTDACKGALITTRQSKDSFEMN